MDLMVVLLLLVYLLDALLRRVMLWHLVRTTALLHDFCRVQRLLGGQIGGCLTESCHLIDLRMRQSETAGALDASLLLRGSFRRRRARACNKTKINTASKRTHDR